MPELKIKNYVINTPLIDILKKVKGELLNGKLKDIQDKHDSIRVTCPFHKEGLEDHPSCSIYCGDINDSVEYGGFHCFTCNESGSFAHFVGACFDKNIEFGSNWLIANFGYTLYNTPLDLPEINLNETKLEEYLDESILDTFQSWHPYMEKRKLTPEVCNKFEVKYDPKTQCLIFPVRDEFGNLLMLTKRSVVKKQFYIEFNKEKPLYLYNYITQNNITEVTLVESQINCLTLWSYGIPSCALFGTGTKYQYEILNKSSLKHIYLALDADNAGWKGIYRLINNLRSDIIIDVIELPLGKDVNDITEEEFDNLPILNSWDWVAKHNLKLS